MIYSKNYDKMEIKINFDCSREKLPKGWSEDDQMKVLGTESYPIDKNYRII